MNRIPPVFIDRMDRIPLTREKTFNLSILSMFFGGWEIETLSGKDTEKKPNML